jgi:hypothetical protein
MPSTTGSTSLAFLLTSFLIASVLSGCRRGRTPQTKPAVGRAQVIR